MSAYRFTGLAAGLILGIVAALTEITLLNSLLIVLLILGAVVSWLGWRAEKRWIEWPRTVIFFAALAISLPLGHYRTQQVLDQSHPQALANQLDNFESGERLVLRGIIAAEPEWRQSRIDHDKEQEYRGGGRVDITLRVQKIRSSQAVEDEWFPVSSGNALVTVFAYDNSSDESIAHLHRLAMPKSYGNEIEVEARYDPIEPPLNPHAFDYAAFLRQNGIDTSMRCHASRVKVLNERIGNPLTALALRTKTHFLKSLKRSIRASASRIAAASTLGLRRSVERIEYPIIEEQNDDKEEGKKDNGPTRIDIKDSGPIRIDIAEMFRHAGVGHVLAVSGLHVSVIAVLLFALFRMTGTSPRIFVPPLIFFLIVFALLTGARPSAVRAVVMNSFILFTIAYFRCNLRTATAIGLSASAFVILLNNPLLLFAPSFLLSYFAVLSLIVLAPPFDRFLCTLRGFSAILFLVWFSLLMGIAGWRFYWLTSPINILALGGLLWVFTLLGGLLNRAMPRMWNTGFARIHPLIRMFVAAQLAIQIGMMLPMSAWFFGRFPVAGILVNLIAIPVVGILVQLGMLVGLIGLIPVVGQWVALPFGAATALVGEFFLLTAYVGARLFPFPATPQPSILQLGIYYMLVAGILFAEQNRHAILDRMYRLPYLQQQYAKAQTIFAFAMALALIAMPWIIRQRGLPTAKTMQILANQRYPLITIQGGHAADLINAGDRFQGGRLLFDHLRAKGSVVLNNIYVPSPDPRAGIEGATSLAERLKIQNVWLPVIPQTAERFTEALADEYLIRTASEGVPWAANYDTAFENLLHSHQQSQNPRQLKTLSQNIPPAWDNVRVRTLPTFTNTVTRFLTSARTPIIEAEINGVSWIIITDTMPEALAEVLAHAQPCQVLVLSDISSRVAYFRWLQAAVEHFNPEVLIIGGNAPVDWSTPQQRWFQDEKNRGLEVFQTGIDGALKVILPRSGGIHLQSYRTQRQLEIRPH